jgi:hypothetical protein
MGDELAVGSNRQKWKIVNPSRCHSQRFNRTVDLNHHYIVGCHSTFSQRCLETAKQEPNFLLYVLGYSAALGVNSSPARHIHCVIYEYGIAVRNWQTLPLKRRVAGLKITPYWRLLGSSR